MAYLPARYANMPFGMPQQVQETPEVAAARRAHLAAHALAAARVSKVVSPPPVAVANQQLSNSVVVATNGILATLPSFLPVGSWIAPVRPQPVQDTPEVHAAKLAFFRAFNEAAVRSG